MSTSRARLLGAIPLALATTLVGGTLLATPAVAAPGDDVLVFSNANVVDTSSADGEGELRNIVAALEDIGLVVTEFDGGDGSAAAWSTALAGIESVVFPESEEGTLFLTGADASDAWLSDAAAAALGAWAQAGGTVLLSGQDESNTGQLLSVLTGADFDGAWVNGGSSSSAPRVIADASLPAVLPEANGTYPPTIADWTPAQLALLTPWYVEGDNLWVGVLAAGSGRVAIESWDYYPYPGNSSGECGAVGEGSDAQVTYEWNRVLSGLLGGGAPTAPGVAPAWTGDGIPVDITTTFGAIEGSGNWIYDGPAIAAVDDRPVGAGAELSEADFVENPSGFDGCFAIDVDPAAQTITVTPLVDGEYYGALDISVSSPRFASVALVSDGLFDTGENNWGLGWGFANSTLTASWNDDLAGYAADEETEWAQTLEDGSAVFSYTLTDVALADSGADDASGLIAAAFALLALGGIALIVRRRATA